MQRPNATLKALNWTTLRALMKTSAIWSPIRTCSSIIFLLSTISPVKWWQLLMCLVLLCWTEFLEIFIALELLSQHNIIASYGTLYSFNICFIPYNWVQLLPVAIYLVSKVDNERHSFASYWTKKSDCFLEKSIH